MKESIGGTQLFIIVIVLIIIFASVMSFTINRSNAYAVKDKIVSVIEKAGQFDMSTEITDFNTGKGIGDTNTLNKIVEVLAESQYRQSGDCSKVSSSAVGYQRNGAQTIGNNKSSFCIQRVNALNNKQGTIRKYYYKVILFYKLDLPIVGDAFTFTAIGETKILYK